MPRQPRLDAPGTLHHVMGRGIERTKIFQNKTDGDDFLNRKYKYRRGQIFILEMRRLKPARWWECKSIGGRQKLHSVMRTQIPHLK